MTTSLKTCFKCGAEKPLTEFYKHPMMGDGHLNKCKECTKKDSRRHRRENIGYYRQYDIERYRDNPERQAKVLAWYKRKLAASPAMRKASNMVSNAIRDGRLVRQRCEACGESKTEAHHVDYLKPLDVMWLCRGHHIQWHHDNGPGLNAGADPDSGEKAA